MKKISEALDAVAEGLYGNIRHKFFGLSELVSRQTQRMPVTIPDRKQVALDDNFDLITWMRCESTVDFEYTEEMSYGKTDTFYQVAELRYIVAAKSKELGEEFIHEFAKSLPVILTVEGHKVVFVGETRAIDLNHESVYNTELDETAYSKHRLKWNVSALILNIKFIVCS